MEKINSFRRIIFILPLILCYKTALSQMSIKVNYENVRFENTVHFYAANKSDTIHIQSYGRNKYSIAKEKQTRINSVENTKFVVVEERRIYILPIEDDLFSTSNMIEITLRKKKKNKYSANLRYCEGECMIVAYPEVTTHKIRRNKLCK